MSDSPSNPELICPECQYDLRAADPDSTGIFTCPECGEHWTLKSLQERKEAAAKKHNRLRDFGFGVAFPVVWLFWVVATGHDPTGGFVGSGITMVSYLAIVAVISTPVQAWRWYQVATRFAFLLLLNCFIAIVSSLIVVVAVQVAIALIL